MCIKSVYAWQNCAVTEKELLELWNRARTHLVFAQLAPTFLLITTVGLVPGIREAGPFAVWATLGILVASGILGALVEFAAAHEAQAVARDLAAIVKPSHTTRTIIRFAPWLHVAKFVTPAIFVGIFVALAGALLGF
jgi:hypothetical protein